MTRSLVFWSVLAYAIYCLVTGYSSQWKQIFTTDMSGNGSKASGNKTSTGLSSSGLQLPKLESL